MIPNKPNKIKVNVAEREVRLELPDPPMPEPNQFSAVEARRSRDGTFAQSIAERFPFGFRHKYRDPAMNFNWGTEAYDFKEDWLSNNAKLLRWHNEVAIENDKEKRLFNRMIEKELALNWYLYLADNLKYKNQVRYERHLYAHIDMVNMYFKRVEDRYKDNHKLYMGLKVKSLEHNKELWNEWLYKMKQNPYRDAVKWPSDTSWASKISLKEFDLREVRGTIKNDRDENIQALREVRDRGMMRQLAAHELAYTWKPKEEAFLVYINSKQVGLRRKVTFKPRFGKIRAGTTGKGIRPRDPK